MAVQPMTDLDKKLQEMAIKNWPQFVALLGDDALMAAKICLLRQNNRSLGEISKRLDMPRQTIASHVKRHCQC